MFYASHEHFEVDNEGFSTILASGKVHTHLPMSAEHLASGAFDEAWNSLEALAAFPERFPIPWRNIVGRVENDCVQV